MIVDHDLYISFKESVIQGRYVINEQIISFLDTLNSDFQVASIGFSVQQRPIHSVTVGHGSQKILMWSQMHGNESTTTKAVLDLFRFLASDNAIARSILQQCSLQVIPMLNPDGAEAYTRVNANAIDLNRDAQDLSQPESQLLRRVYEDFQPDFCFNLHDQRTIFNVGNTNQPATVSFLAPSHDEARSISETRAISMQLIAAMNAELQKKILGQVGRYDDGFNANCVGDTFQMLNTPTILFEAGHFSKDYNREMTREYIFYALLKSLQCISEDQIHSFSQEEYFEIPENNKGFFDILIKNAHLVDPSNAKDVGILFDEVLSNSEISFEPRIEKEGDLDAYFGHSTYNCANKSDLELMKKNNIWIY